MSYSGLDFDRAELSHVMRSNYEDIIQFIVQPVFQRLFSEMMKLPAQQRPKYVSDVWLNSEVLRTEGLDTPPGILIQTSAFGDRRPTLFVVKKFLPEKYHRAWENVNWTFNNDFKMTEVPFDAASSWRLPLSVSVQNSLLSNGIDLQSVPNESKGFLQDLYSGDIVKSELRDQNDGGEP